RTVEDGSWRFGLLTGLFVWLQILSCIYYGIFLAMMVGVLAIALLARARAAWPAVAALALGALLATACTLPYAAIYVEAASALGTRSASEIAQHSAQPASYLATSSANWWWGWTGDRFSGDEL